jgi:hypothetical protein
MQLQSEMLSTNELAMRLGDLVIYAVDVGSVKQGNFAWASSARAGDCHMETLIAAIAEDFAASRAVALGFESPLWVPMADDPEQLTCARRGEGSRSWSAGAGCGALATGLVQSTWVLDRLRRAAPSAVAYLEWSSFAVASGPRLLIWEAFVSGKAKGIDHGHDAAIAVDAFVRALPDPTSKVAVTPDRNVHSLIGAALLRTAWTSDPTVLSKPCLVLGANAPADRSQQERDDELVSYLVRMGLSQWFRDHGRPAIAELYARMAREPRDSRDSPKGPRKRRAKKS